MRFGLVQRYLVRSGSLLLAFFSLIWWWLLPAFDREIAEAESQSLRNLTRALVEDTPWFKSEPDRLNRLAERFETGHRHA